MHPDILYTVEYLEARSQDYWMAFVQNTNYDIAKDTLRWMIRSGQCDKSVALAMYWSMSAGYFVQYGDRSQVPAHERLDYNIVKKIERMYLADEFPMTGLGFDPTPHLNDYAGVPVVTPIPEAMKTPVPGRQVDTAALTRDWENGLPPEVWARLDADEAHKNFTEENP